jgi:UDP-glucose 4-epimerase
VRILVTGSSGLLGTAIATALAPTHQVVGLDRRPGPATSHLGELEDHALLATAMVGVEAVIHTASLHAPHVGRIDRGTFIRVNVDATRHLLELAAAAGIRHVVYTSTTSVYGRALVPRDRAVWVTEALRPQPRDIYDETKLAAEALCAQFSRETSLPVICLRTARFFPEPPELTATYRLHRGVDVRDVVTAHLLAVEHETMPFGVFNISAESPFREMDTNDLLRDAPGVIRRRLPWAEQAWADRGWRLPDRIDRVYAIAAAQHQLGFQPRYNVADLFANASATE